MTGTLLERSGLVPAILRFRHKRFLAEVRMEDGSEATAHCTNTGTMRSCWEPGDPVLLQPAADPSRKLKHTWLACRRGGCWVGVDTGVPNAVVAEAARRDVLPGCKGLHSVRTEVKYGEESSRIDVLAKDADGRQVFIEVKNTTLNVDGLGCFPDAVSERGLKHLRELQHAVRQGHRAVIAFFIQRGDVAGFRAAGEVDPAYAAELQRAAAAGVEVLPLQVHLVPDRAADGSWSLRWSLAGLLPWVGGRGGL